MADQTADAAAWEAKYKAAREVISDLCAGKRNWTMSVPARPYHDPDLVICDALYTMRTALLGATEGHRNNVAAVKWIAQQFCDEFGNPKADMPQWAHDITDILVLGETPAPHPAPRGRVEVIPQHVRNDWKREKGRGMTSALGEYTPPEFWTLLDAYEALLAARTTEGNSDA